MTPAIEPQVLTLKESAEPEISVEFSGEGDAAATVQFFRDWIEQARERKILREKQSTAA